MVMVTGSSAWAHDGTLGSWAAECLHPANEVGRRICDEFIHGASNMWWLENGSDCSVDSDTISAMPSRVRYAIANRTTPMGYSTSNERALVNLVLELMWANCDPQTDEALDTLWSLQTQGGKKKQ